MLADKGDYAAAGPLYREAVVMRRKLLGDEHPDVAESLKNLAGVLERRGEYAEAEELVRESLRICDSKLNPNDRLRFLAATVLAAR